MDLPDIPERNWKDIRRSVLVDGSVEWVHQNEVPPIPHELDAHTDVLPGIRVHHRSWASRDDIAIWEPANTNIYLVTQYEIVEKLLESKDEIPQEVLNILLLAGGAVVIKFLWDILQNLADDDAEPTTSTTESRSQQVPRPADRQYNIFISHAWDYNDEYERVVNFLNDFDELDWQNHSVPQDDPLDTVNDTHLRSQLQDQIRTTAVVLVLAGMYSSHREWIQTEIELANEFDKPIVGIRPHGSEQTPNVVEDAAVEMVGWRQKSIVRAIVEHAV
jgi:hypothetical protein